MISERRKQYVEAVVFRLQKWYQDIPTKNVVDWRFHTCYCLHSCWGTFKLHVSHQPSLLRTTFQYLINRTPAAIPPLPPRPHLPPRPRPYPVVPHPLPPCTPLRSRHGNRNSSTWQVGSVWAPCQASSSPKPWACFHSFSFILTNKVRK